MRPWPVFFGNAAGTMAPSYVKFSSSYGKFS
jgi:hypothetical protein